MEEGHQRAGQDQQAADPEGRGRLALGRLVEVVPPHDDLEGQEQAGRGDEADDRREQQRLEDVDGLPPIDAGGAVAPAHELVGEADAEH